MHGSGVKRTDGPIIGLHSLQGSLRYRWNNEGILPKMPIEPFEVEELGAGTLNYSPQTGNVQSSMSDEHILHL